MNDEFDRGISEAQRVELEAFFKQLVGAYMNFPAALKLELKESYRSWALMIEPDVCDYAICAGKRGRNFNALKTLVDAIGERKRIEIELLLEGPPAEDTRHIRKQLPYKVNPNWEPNDIKEIVSETLRMIGIGHVQLRVQKNRTIDQTNPFDDQSFYWFTDLKNQKEALLVMALGQLMESIGTAQGQRLMPRGRDIALALEKAS